MTPEEVSARVEMIRRLADDPERAHSEEDRLRTDILRWLADEHWEREAAAVAKAALETSAIGFARWRA